MKKHILILASLTLISLSGCASADSESMQANVLQSQDCSSLVSLAEQEKTDDDFVLLDVRTGEEYAETHIPNAINIDFYSPSFSSDIAQMDKSKNYLVYCRSGNRSGKAVSIMKGDGFKNTCSLEGGIAKWQADGKPVLTSG
jgi:rhodanese-related sulfurtransferase